MYAASKVVWGEAVGVSPYEECMFPQDPGVYVFAQVDARRAYVRYVGRASNLDERISAHLDGAGENTCLQDVLNDVLSVKVKTAIQHGETARVNLEYTCYKHYERNHPLCNARKPRGSFWKGWRHPSNFNTGGQSGAAYALATGHRLHLCRRGRRPDSLDGGPDGRPS